jgi:molybdopterin-guanine dinucleotide biosynthesis protein A
MTGRPDGSDGRAARVPVYILAGGKSRRFGSDKARAMRGGVPLVVGVARTVEPIASRVTVVASRAGEYDDLGLRTIGDVVAEKGPMGGLLTAIEDCRDEEWLLLSACDWVGIRAEWVQLMLGKRRDESQAVVLWSGRYEPLFALYRTTIRDVVSEQIDTGQLTMQTVLERIVSEVIPVPEGWKDVVNLNEPPDAL